jgi:hypothetical protein
MRGIEDHGSPLPQRDNHDDGLGLTCLIGIYELSITISNILDIYYCHFLMARAENV